MRLPRIFTTGDQVVRAANRLPSGTTYDANDGRAAGPRRSPALPAALAEQLRARLASYQGDRSGDGQH